MDRKVITVTVSLNVWFERLLKKININCSPYQSLWILRKHFVSLSWLTVEQVVQTFQSEIYYGNVSLAASSKVLYPVLISLPSFFSFWTKRPSQLLDSQGHHPHQVFPFCSHCVCRCPATLRVKHASNKGWRLELLYHSIISQNFLTQTNFLYLYIFISLISFILYIYLIKPTGV